MGVGIGVYVGLYREVAGCRQIILKGLDLQLRAKGLESLMSRNTV